MNRKRIIAVFMCFVLLFAAGCSGIEKKQSETREKIVIKVVYPTSRGMGENNISEFENWFAQSFPDATLELASSSATTVTDTVISEFKNGNAPDIFVTTDYDTFVKNGYLAEVTGITALTRFRKSSVRNLERDGKVYALPIGGGNLVGLHYNKTLFDEYGLEYPKTTETMYELVARVNRVIQENDLDKRPVGASLLYPSQASAIMNAAFAQETQTSDYLAWITNYDDEDVTFKDTIFQDYLKKIDYMINKQKDSEGNEIADAGKLFGRDDFFSTQASSIKSFLNGTSFMYIGDVNRCYSTYGTEGSYDKDDFSVMGIPVGLEGVSYVSYFDDLYMGINSDYINYSDRKREIISQMLEYIVSPDNTAKNIFTYTGNYCSVYLEGKSVERSDEEYFSEINQSLDNNYVSQEVNNTPFSSVFGKILLAWKKGELASVETTGSNDIERVTNILETYRTTGVNLFAKSEEPIGSSECFMEYQSNIVRTQETTLGNQVADMARDYLQTDFAIINAGSIRASIPSGDISVQTLNSVLPYQNYLVKILVSGKTLKKAIANAYDVGPMYKSGQFGDISGLKVSLQTNEKGYRIYSDHLAAWENANPNASETQRNAAIKNIVAQMCDETPDILNLEVVDIRDSKGNAIDDNKLYSVALFDYLLTGGDGYTMLGILNNDNPDADQTIEIYDRNGNRITGDYQQKNELIAKSCLSGADSFVQWVLEGNMLNSKVDGRISIKNYIYIE